MTGLELKEALNKGQRVYGTCVLSTSTRWLDLVPGTGADFVYPRAVRITLEHANWGEIVRVVGLLK